MRNRLKKIPCMFALLHNLWWVYLLIALLTRTNFFGSVYEFPQGLTLCLTRRTRNRPLLKLNIIVLAAIDGRGQLHRHPPGLASTTLRATDPERKTMVQPRYN